MIGLLILLSAPLAVCASLGCRKLELAGEVSSGQNWQASIGQGWFIRLMPIQPPQLGYSGWDIVVDRDPSAGYPDALLLATPPYDSINQREIGTTFGLRAQDAAGWNPRSFRFLTDPASLAEAQKLYARLTSETGPVAAGSSPAYQQDVRRMSELLKKSAAGEFRIVDARLTPGVADAQPYAESWARALARTTYTIQPAPQGKATPLGTLNWIRFTIGLWLPASWHLPPGSKTVPGPCLP